MVIIPNWSIPVSWLVNIFILPPPDDPPLPYPLYLPLVPLAVIFPLFLYSSAYKTRSPPVPFVPFLSELLLVPPGFPVPPPSPAPPELPFGDPDAPDEFQPPPPPVPPEYDVPAPPDPDVPFPIIPPEAPPPVWRPIPSFPFLPELSFPTDEPPAPPVAGTYSYVPSAFFHKYTSCPSALAPWELSIVPLFSNFPVTYIVNPFGPPYNSS